MTVTLGGKERTLKLTVGAIAKAERRHDVELDVKQFHTNPPSFAYKAAFIGLLHSDDSLDEFQVYDWLDAADRDVVKTIARFAFEQVGEGFQIIGELNEEVDDDSGNG